MPAAPGRTLIRSAGRTDCCCVFLKSTSGAAEVTVTDSLTLPTDSSASTSATNPPCTTMPSRTTVPNPWSWKVTE